MNVSMRVESGERNKGITNIGFRYPTKPDIGTVFDDWIARAAEIDIDIAAVVHAELTT